MTLTATPNAIAGLAARLTDSQDREAYAALVSYINELPPGDEFRQLTELLGLLSLVGQRVPDALAELLQELRTQTTAAKEYHRQVDARLASLPSAITSGIDLTGIREAFRQQIATTGLEEAAGILNHAASTIKIVTTEALLPTATEYKRISTNIAAEAQKLAAAGEHLRLENLRLVREERANRRLWVGMLCIAMLAIGMVAGIAIEKHQPGSSGVAGYLLNH